tara:strand:+ start:348 stop:740 length:393 start_codon:yes stop_codon:yes gene_type:complete
MSKKLRPMNRKNYPFVPLGRKECERRARQRNKFKFNTMTREMYKAQKNSSKTRGHEPPEYSLDEFRAWLKNQPHLEFLMNEYKESGGEKDYRPSVDRIDNSIGYNFKNIRLVNWFVNRHNRYRDMKNKPF